MAEKILNTRVLLNIDSLDNWNSSTLVIKNGELAFAETVVGSEPVIMCKVGDGTSTFSQLPWSFYAKSSDVLNACKNENSLKMFINNTISGADFVTNSHVHANKNLLDTYTQTEANLSNAVNQTHSHSNKSELDKIADGDKEKIDSAIQSITGSNGIKVTKNGTGAAIEFDDDITFVLNCGSSTV